MRVEGVKEGEQGKSILLISMNKEEEQKLYPHWHDEVQVVAGSGVTALLKEAARRLQE